MGTGPRLSWQDKYFGWICARFLRAWKAGECPAVQGDGGPGFSCSMSFAAEDPWFLPSSVPWLLPVFWDCSSGFLLIL